MSAEWLNQKIAILTLCARKPCEQKPFKFTYNKHAEKVSKRPYNTKPSLRVLTEDQVRFIRLSKDTNRVLAEVIGAAESTIWQARKGHTYKDIT